MWKRRSENLRPTSQLEVVRERAFSRRGDVEVLRPKDDIGPDPVLARRSASLIELRRLNPNAPIGSIVNILN